MAFVVSDEVRWGFLTFVTMLFMQAVGACVALCIHCWHRGTEMSVRGWQTLGSGERAPSLIWRQLIQRRALYPLWY